MPKNKPKIKMSIELDHVDQQNLSFLVERWNTRSKVAAIVQALSVARGLVENGATIRLPDAGGQGDGSN